MIQQKSLGIGIIINCQILTVRGLSQLCAQAKVPSGGSGNTATFAVGSRFFRPKAFSINQFVILVAFSFFTELLSTTCISVLENSVIRMEWAETDTFANCSGVMLNSDFGIVPT